MSTRPTPGLVEDRNRPAVGDVEQRNAPTAAPTVDGRRVHGVIPYGVESRDLGGFREVIECGALTGARMDDLIATVDHGGVPIGRHPGTLQLEDRDDGLHWSLELPESRSDVREAIQRGDLCAGSWRMVVAEDRWEGDVRHVLRIDELRDVSIVSSPAYQASVVEPRSRPDSPPAGPTPGLAPRRGGLRVEDRTATGQRPVEDRVLDAMRAVPTGEARDLTHATAAPVEPPELSTFLWDRLRDQAVILRSGVPVITTDRKSVSWPVLVGDIEADFYDELEEIVESDPDLDDFELTPKAIKALVRGSSEAFEDSDPDLLRIVQANMETALALKLDREFLVGNHAKGFLGLTQMAGTQSLVVDAALGGDAGTGGLGWAPIVKATGKLAEQGVPGPYAVAMHPRVQTALDLAVDADGNPLTRPANLPPVYSTRALAITDNVEPDPDTTTVVVYAPKQLAVVRRRDVTVEVDRSQEFTKDAVLVRGKVRATLGTPHPEAVVKLTGVHAPAIS